MIPYYEPILFYIPVVHRPIHAFGVLVALGILLGVPQVVKRGKQLGMDGLAVSNMCTWAIVTGFIFSHVFDVLTYQTSTLATLPWWDGFGMPSRLWNIIDITGGLSSFGGFLGALFAILIWVRIKRFPLLAICDASLYGLVTGWFFGRCGCFSAHDHPGRPTSFFLGVNYGYHEPGGVRHDLGLYEALFTLGLVIAFRILFKKVRPAGFYVAVTALSYGPVRFLLDFLRVVDERYLGLTPAQYGSIAVFIAGLVVALRLRNAPPVPAVQIPTAVNSPQPEAPAPTLPSAK